MEFLLFTWVVLAILVGMWASNRGRSGPAWFMVSLALSPLLAMLILAIVGKTQATAESDAIDSGTMRKCPFCAEAVRREAVKCKHCGSELPPA